MINAIIYHDAVSLERLAYQILALGINTRVVIKTTGRYHEPVAQELHDHGIFVSVVNPLAIYGIAAVEPSLRSRTTRMIL